MSNFQNEIVDQLHREGIRKPIEGVHLIEWCDRCKVLVSRGNDNTPNPVCPQDHCKLNMTAKAEGS